MNWLFFLAADSPIKTLAENSHDWIPFYGALLITIITAFVNIFKGRSKGRTDQFRIFMDESAQYREELREEKNSLKKEVDGLKQEKEILHKNITEYHTQLDACKKNVDIMQKQLEESKVSLALLEEKLRQARDVTV